MSPNVGRKETLFLAKRAECFYSLCWPPGQKESQTKIVWLVRVTSAKEVKVNYMGKVLSYVMTILATIAGMLWLQVEGLFPLPGTPGWWYIHPLYSFPVWAYLSALAFFGVLAVIFTQIGRKRGEL